MAKLRILTKTERIRRAWIAFRVERDRRLAQTDWVVFKYAETGQAIPEEWRQYRQALRDLPEKLTDEEVLARKIPWPVRPDEAEKEEKEGGTE